MLTPAFRVLWSRQAPVAGLLCLVCNHYSWHPRNVALRYCARCRLFLAELPDDFPQHHTLDGRMPKEVP
jgi:hypothetical protein